jgi:membrane associated rhomboid family serine protease
MYFFYFYPLGLDLRRRRRPVLSWSLMAVMAGAFVWSRYFPLAGDVRPWDLIFQPGYGAPWTAVTAIFLHGGWIHLLGNLVYFQVFAPPLEDRLGPVRFLLYFLVLGTAGNLVHGITTNLGILGPRGVGVLGASGAIAGLIAFAMVRFYSSRVTVAWWVLAPLGGQNRAGRSPVPLAAAAVLWLLFQVVQALVAGETGANVSFGAHLGGFVMGLVLALAMGGLGAARSDAAAGRARRYFRAGHFHAAAGAWTEYLDREPHDLEARLDLARALHVSGQDAPARQHFRGVFRAHVQAGRVADALAVAEETCRSLGAGGLEPDDLARVAYYREKQLDDRGALAAYEMLYGFYPEHPQGQRALVRIIVLCHGKLKDPAEARRWLDKAWLTMKPGSWRSYLESEFNLAAGPYGDSRPGPPATDPAPAP